MAGAAERETAGSGSGSGVRCNARLSRFVNSALPRTRVRGSLGFASAVRSSSGVLPMRSLARGKLTEPSG